MTKEVEINTNSDIGTFVYISKAIGVELDTVVKWFILIIVLVFDPLSICLVLAYNFLVKREDKPEEPKTFAVYDERPENKQAELDPNDPYPQYMTKEETEEVLENFWKKKTMVKYKDINIF